MSDFFRGRRTILLLAVCIVAGGCQKPAGTGATPSGSSTQTAPPGKIVQLVIDFGDGGQKRFPAIAWRDGMTVLDALGAAKAIPHGITLDAKGSGESALVKQIDDVVNQAGAAGKNWLFYVNDKLAKRSCGVATIQPGDAVLWKFEPYVE
jgi:hypothetical protein